MRKYRNTRDSRSAKARDFHGPKHATHKAHVALHEHLCAR